MRSTTDSTFYHLITTWKGQHSFTIFSLPTTLTKREQSTNTLLKKKVHNYCCTKSPFKQGLNYEIQISFLDCKKRTNKQTDKKLRSAIILIPLTKNKAQNKDIYN